MINIPALLTQERVNSHISLSSKKRTFEYLSQVLCEYTELSERKLYDCLLARERLGSTGLGAGVAIPHARVKGLSEPIGVLATLIDPCDFDSIDDHPVDIIFALLIPEVCNDTHLQLLAGLAAGFSDPDFTAKIRQASCAGDLYTVAKNWPEALLE